MPLKNQITPYNVARLASIMLAYSAESMIFEEKYLEKGKIKLGEIRTCMSQALRDPQDKIKAANLLTAFKAILPLLTPDFIEKLLRQSQALNRRTKK